LRLKGCEGSVGKGEAESRVNEACVGIVSEASDGVNGEAASPKV